MDDEIDYKFCGKNEELNATITKLTRQLKDANSEIILLKQKLKEFEIKQPDILSVLEKDLLELEEKEIKEPKTTKSEEKNKKSNNLITFEKSEKEEMEMDDIMEMIDIKFDLKKKNKH